VTLPPSPPPDRLSALDYGFIALDSAEAPLHVGWTMRFDGDAPSLAGLRRHLEARLGFVPRFRRCVSIPALGPPVTGVRAVTLGRLGGEEEHRDLDRGDAVDERVVGLADEREAAPHAADEVQLPQRAAGIERAREQGAGESPQIGPAARRRQSHLLPRYRDNEPNL
jgi:hypothetical protein